MIWLPRRACKGFGTDEIAAMSLSAVLARDEPSRPPVGNWSALINVFDLTLSIEFAGWISANRTDKMSRYAESSLRSMTAQAILIARESRPIEPLIVQSVENAPEFRIGRRDLQRRRTRDERHINV